jgi:hypothetical protein
MQTLFRRALFTVCVLFAAGAAAAFAPTTGHWWNPNESGTGYNIDVRNGVLIMTIYTYKTNGDSEWYLASGPLSADQHAFSGTLDKYRNGQCISCAYPGPPVLVGNDGEISVHFLTESQATVALPGGRVTTIQPYFATPVPDGGSLEGTYTLIRATVDYLDGPLFDTVNAGAFSMTGTMVIGGGQATQTVAMTMGTQTITLASSGSLTDFGSYVVVESPGLQAARAALISRSPVLITERIFPTIGSAPPGSEIDQWGLVSRATNASVQRSDLTLLDSLPTPIGAEIATLLGITGIRPTPVAR